jgi:hypothetical protein
MTRLITEDERRAYGDEALSVMGRKAREVMQPVVQDMYRQNQQLRGELQRIKSNDVYSMLDQTLENWREINQNQEWKDWLTFQDPLSGVPRQQLLNQAFAAGDAGRVLVFFNGFLNENAQQPAARAPRISADEKPFITNKEIDHFYSDVAHGRYEGREKEKMARENQIHRAIMEGRLQRVTS